MGYSIKAEFSHNDFFVVCSSNAFLVRFSSPFSSSFSALFLLEGPHPF